MAQEREEKINAFGKLFSELYKDHLPREDYERGIKQVLELLAKTKQKDQEDFARVSKQLLETFQEMRQTMEGEVSKHKDSLSGAAGMKLIESELARLKELEAQIVKRVAEVKDGKDGISPDFDAVVEAIKPFIPPPIPGSPDSPEDIVGKLESLKGDARLDASAIKNLPKGGGGSIAGRDLFKDYDLSPYLDGVTKTFNIPATWNIIAVHTSSFPHALRKTVDFTYTPQTITFTDEIDAATTLAEGQTVVLTLVTA